MCTIFFVSRIKKMILLWFIFLITFEYWFKILGCYRYHKYNNKKGVKNPAITNYKETFTILKYHKNNIQWLQDHQHLLFFLNMSYITPSHYNSHLKISRTSTSFKCIWTHPKTYMNVVPRLSSSSCQRHVTGLFITKLPDILLDFSSPIHHHFS